MTDGPSYREVVAALADLANVDAEIQACQAADLGLDRSLEVIRSRLEEMSIALESQQQRRMVSGKAPSRINGLVASDAAAPAEVVSALAYRELIEDFEHRVEVTRSRRRILRSELRVLQGRRNHILADIPFDVLSRCEAIWKEGHIPALATVSHGQCGGCGESLHHGIDDDLAAGDRPVQCPRCHRFLAPATCWKFSPSQAADTFGTGRNA